ncbi:MAG: hypothetical protein KME07_05640 [Pegethrix bostrychoides GSE-TBD4-15B]|jgi:hypothetical protein|uniref:Uncharacterized protein n=1 Tax=Pegethrix bostrychoides GSE-TBD4-15B TaxID=2839662 RepID=A0A951P8X8_9CYAN|nr:hypothetical protein [Pegethrix bostrychoides GSE-TBD4-15B]
MVTTATRSDQPSIRQVRLYKQADTIIKPAQLNRSYHVCIKSENTKRLGAEQNVHTIQFQNGSLFIDQIHIARPRFANDFVSWRQLTQSHYSCGHLRFLSGGVMLQGLVSLGTTGADAVPYSVVASYFPLVSDTVEGGRSTSAVGTLRTFTTQITKQRYAIDPVTKQPIQDPSLLPDNAWQPGLSLRLGYDVSKGTSIVQLGNEDISIHASYKPASQPDQTKLVIAPDLGCDSLCARYSDVYVGASITLTLDNHASFSGTVANTCAESDDSSSGVYFWRGTSPALAIAAAVRPTFLSKANLLQDTSLTVDELAGLLPGTATPQTDINTTANSMLIENMKWAICQRSDEKDWLKLFYGDQEAPPVLSQERVTLINKNLSWYQDTYAKAQFGWQAANYGGTNQPATQLTHYQALQLRYFLQTGIAQDSNFVSQQQGLYPEAYAESFPRIRAYLADGGEKWANELMNQIYLPNLGLEVASVKLTNDMSSVNAFCTLLTVLQPSGELAKQYYTNFLTATLQSNVDAVSFQDSTTLMQWLPLWLEQFLIQAVNLPETIPDAAKLAIAQLNEMMGQMGGNATKVAQEIVPILVNSPGSTIWDVCKGAEEAWATKFPKLSAIGRVFFFAAFGYGLSMIVQAFGNWKNLSDEDRAKLVVATVGFGVDGLLIVPEMLISIKDMGTDILNKINVWRYSSKTQEGIDQIGKAIDENYLENGLDETSKLFNAETKAIEAEGSLWEKLFGDVLKPVLKVAGVVVAAIVAAFSVYDLIQDVKSGQPITKIALDAVIAATNIAVVICTVVEIALASTVASVLGVVFALIGIIISIIEQCVIKPADPLDDFMKNVVVPFVDALPPQIPLSYEEV